MSQAVFISTGFCLLKLSPFRYNLHFLQLEISLFKTMNGENRPLVTDEPVEFEK